MPDQDARRQTSPKPIRLWPGMVLVTLQWLARFGFPILVPGFIGFKNGMLSTMVGAVAIVLWWAFFSRAPRMERWGGLALMVVALLATSRLNHESMGPLWLVGYAVPLLCLALVLWAALTRHLGDGPRRATMVATILVACGGWTLVRTTGIDGNHIPEFQWRFSETPEARMLAQDDELLSEPPRPESSRPAIASTADEPASFDWPGFRGPRRDGIVRGVRIATDWQASPPTELWRRSIGPGWSSFAVSGGLVYTQEQRGDDEVVSCYDAASGEPVWRHRDPVRFYESNAGAGPRATPTLHAGRVYALGATGILNALDADDGGVVWSRNAADDTGAEVPDWGFSSSPLVTDDLVIVDVGGLVAYDLGSGERRWAGPVTSIQYSSPHAATIDGTEQVVLLNSAGISGFAPSDGAPLWNHEWPGFGIVQPSLTAEGDLVISAGAGIGARRLAVSRRGDDWTVEERWASTDLKAYFSDLVVHEGHAYGFDGRILACIDLAGGQRVWKGGRYGNGQLVLLSGQDLLLVLAETGDLALVEATPDAFNELARMPAIEGKTWNHPVLAGDLLLVRNGREMVAFRLAVVGA